METHLRQGRAALFDSLLNHLHSTTFQTDDLILLPLLFFIAAGYATKGCLWSKPDPNHHRWFERPVKPGIEEARVTRRSRNIVEQLKLDGSSVVVFWGSQTGTAERFAHRIAQDLHQRFKTTATVADLSDFDPETIVSVPADVIPVFILATYGEGDPTDNSNDFMTWLSHAAPTLSLSHVRYAAFGLGNSNYRHFNKVVDDACVALDSFGANQLVPKGRADDAQRNTEEDFLSWKDHLLATLATALNLEETDNYEFHPSIQILEDHEAMDRVHAGLNRTTNDGLINGLIDGSVNGSIEDEPIMDSRKSNADSAFRSFPISSHQDLIKPASGRRCVHVELDISSHPEIKYKTGGHVAIMPINPAEEVSLLLQVLRFQTKRCMHIRIVSLQDEAGSGKAKTYPQQSIILETLFQTHLDICGPVSREVIHELARFTKCDQAKSMLTAIGKNRSTYEDLKLNHHITFARILELVSSQCPEETWQNLPLAFVIERLRPITPRLYSISSSSTVSPRKFTLTVAVKDTSLSGKSSSAIPGLTSTYISSMGVSDSVTAQVRQSAFKLPVRSQTPLILIAAGTGIAPFRGFLQERARLSSNGRDVGPVLLFFGCQNSDDFIYGDELRSMQDGPLRGKLNIITAFSREQSEKIYVQQRVHENSNRVLRLLFEEDAALYICGAASMSRSVGQIIRDKAERWKGWSQTDVREWRSKLKRTKRWQEDVWG